MRSQHGTSPLPHSAQFGLTSKPVPEMGHGDRVPVLEADICVFEVDEEGGW
jgi:hypothetical protein